METIPNLKMSNVDFERNDDLRASINVLSSLLTVETDYAASLPGTQLKPARSRYGLSDAQTKEIREKVVELTKQIK